MVPGGKWLKIGVVAFYALATIVVALVVPAHDVQRGRPGSSSHSAAGARLCKAQGEKGDSRLALDCCEPCQLSEAGGLKPAHAASLRLRRDWTRRVSLTSLPRAVDDATPDNLRSRAPPVLAVPLV